MRPETLDGLYLCRAHEILQLSMCLQCQQVSLLSMSMGDWHVTSHVINKILVLIIKYLTGNENNGTGYWVMSDIFEEKKTC